MGGSIDGYSARDEGSMGRAGDEMTVSETEIIEADIRETRERLGDTVEEIGERLNPRRLKQQVKNDIREATIGRVENMAQQAGDKVSEAQRTVLQSVRENPIPFAMIGVGLGWIIWNRNSSSSSSTRRYSDGYDQEYGTDDGYDGLSASYSGSGMGSTGRQGWSGSGMGRSGASGTMDRAREKASEVADTMKQKTSQLADKTHQAMDQVTERAEDMAGTVADQARYQTRRVEDQFYSNPLAIGAVAIALGLIGGLAIPETRKESELMGGARDHLMDQMKDVAQETKEKVQQVTHKVVDEAQHTAKDAAQQTGLMS